MKRLSPCSSSSTLHLILDHSALIPCEDKPEEEREAIRRLGNTLPQLNAVWYVSREYLRTLFGVLAKESKYCRPLPKLQSSLTRTLLSLIELANSRNWHCKERRPKEEMEFGAEVVSLRIHVVARTALYALERENREVSTYLTCLEVSPEDSEVMAIAIISTRYASLTTLVATDPHILQAPKLAQLSNLKILTPKQLAEELR